VEIGFLLVALAVGVLVGTAVADRLDVPAPLVLVVGGIAASFVPGVPEVQLSADVVLFGLLPPLLYAAALKTSLVDFKANRRPILLLSVGLVVFTAVGVAVLVRLVLPGTDWWAAFAIGAVVAPPDPVAATAIGRRIGLPRRLLTILEGESLLNDATALVLLRTAIATTAGAVSVLDVGLEIAVAAGGGVLVGVAVHWVVSLIRRRVHDPVFDVAISLVIPFAAYLTAEAFHGSGVIAVVVAGLLISHSAPLVQTASSRISERNNWRTIAYVLEGAVFLLIGLQARWIILDVGASGLSLGRIVAVCATVLVAVVVLRMAWVFPARYLMVRAGLGPTGRDPAPWTHTLVLGWAGIRGVVTLAAAFVIPEDAPHRELLLLVAFTVVAGTLLVQGLSLPWLSRRLGVLAPDPAEDALARATLLHQATEAGLEVLERESGEDAHAVSDAIRHRIEQRNFAVWERLGDPDTDHETPTQTYTRIRLAMLEAERARVLEARDEGTAPQEVIGEVLGMLDIEESMLDVASNEDGGRVGAGRRQAQAVGPLCEHLTSDTDVVEPNTPGECEDCVRDDSAWVHLRACQACGHVGCCDSSPNRHATAHFEETGHPVIESAERGEDWRWCYVHHLTG
jgi:CPA1 family monovalent cation:H+ antiporter